MRIQCWQILSPFAYSLINETRTLFYPFFWFLNVCMYKLSKIIDFITTSIFFLAANEIIILSFQRDKFILLTKVQSIVSNYHITVTVCTIKNIHGMKTQQSVGLQGAIYCILSEQSYQLFGFIPTSVVSPVPQTLLCS